MEGGSVGPPSLCVMGCSLGDNNNNNKGTGAGRIPQPRLLEYPELQPRARRRCWQDLLTVSVFRHLMISSKTVGSITIWPVRWLTNQIQSSAAAAAVGLLRLSARAVRRAMRRTCSSKKRKCGGMSSMLRQQVPVALIIKAVQYKDANDCSTRMPMIAATSGWSTRALNGCLSI
eukprot:1161893-Pelagomonas_calceolata.AAC.4